MASPLQDLIKQIQDLATDVGNLFQLRGFKTGGTAGQVPVKTDGTDFNWSWGTPGGGAWGTITGTLSSQTDLQNALDAKQVTLVSGTNIKTVNGSSLLGSGDLSIVSDLTSGPVTSSAGVSAIADGALSIGKTSGLQSALDLKLAITDAASTYAPISYFTSGAANTALYADEAGLATTATNAGNSAGLGFGSGASLTSISENVVTLGSGAKTLWQTALGLGALATSTDAANLTGNIAVARIATALTTPGPIGGTTASTGAFTTVTASGAVASTNSTTGTIVVTGGVGISGAVYTAGRIQTSDHIQGNTMSGVVYVSSPIIYCSGSIRTTSGVTLLTNDAGTWTSLQFGGTTSAFPRLKRNGTAINIRLADDSADAPLTCSNLTASGTVTATGNAILPTSTTPASASATGVAGTVCRDSDYIYVCVATNTWKRVAISTW